MSVTGEFQRYLMALLDRLGAAAAGGTSGVDRLRDRLEAARERPHAELESAARAALAALDEWRDEGADGGAPQGRPANLQKSCEDLAAICRIILGH